MVVRLKDLTAKDAEKYTCLRHFAAGTRRIRRVLAKKYSATSAGITFAVSALFCIFLGSGKARSRYGITSQRFNRRGHGKNYQPALLCDRHRQNTQSPC